MDCELMLGKTVENRKPREFGGGLLRIKRNKCLEMCDIMVMLKE